MFAKAIGFLIGLSLLVSVLYSIFTHTILQNLPFIAALFILVLIIELVLSRIIKKSEFLDELKAGLKKFGKLVNAIIVGVALIFVYIIGVGFVWIASRIVGKRFMQIKEPENTNWVPERKMNEKDFEEMF